MISTEIFKTRDEAMLYEMAASEKKKISFPIIDETSDSYFEKYEPSDYARETGYDTIPQFITELRNLVDEKVISDDILKICAVSAFKRKPSGNSEKKSRPESYDNNSDLRIPDYVYTF